MVNRKKSWSKCYFDRSARACNRLFRPTDSGAKKNLIDQIGQNHFLIEISTAKFGQHPEFWLKNSVKIRLLYFWKPYVGVFDWWYFDRTRSKIWISNCVWWIFRSQDRNFDRFAIKISVDKLWSDWIRSKFRSKYMNFDQIPSKCRS